MGSLVISVGYIYQWWWKIWTFWEAIALHDTSHWEFSEIQDHQSKPWKQKIFRNSGQRHRRCGLILKKLSKFNTPTVCQWISLCPPLLVGCACHTFALFFSFSLGGLCSTAPPPPHQTPLLSFGSSGLRCCQLFINTLRAVRSADSKAEWGQWWSTCWTLSNGLTHRCPMSIGTWVTGFLCSTDLIYESYCC